MSKAKQGKILEVFSKAADHNSRIIRFDKAVEIPMPGGHQGEKSIEFRLSFGMQVYACHGVSLKAFREAVKQCKPGQHVRYCENTRTFSAGTIFDKPACG